jgi:hypothetical protein
MAFSPQSVLDFSWLAWAVSWGAAAFWSDRAAKRPEFGAEALDRGFVLSGFAMLSGVGARARGRGRGDRRLLDQSAPRRALSQQ